MNPSFWRRMSIPAVVVLTLSFTAMAQASTPERFRERYELPQDRVVRIDVEIDAGEVTFSRCPRGVEAWITIDYDPEIVDVDVYYDPDAPRLEVLVDRDTWLEKRGDKKEAEVLIELPFAVQLDLEADIKAGDVDFELGDLSLVRMELRTVAGEVRVAFSKPNRSVMEVLEINTKVGESRLRHLGNARFRTAEINGGIGELDVDFRGELYPDAAVRIDLDMGKTRLKLPEETGVRLSVSKFLFLSDVNLPYNLVKSGGYYYSRNYERADRHLTLQVSPGLGTLRIE